MTGSRPDPGPATARPVGGAPFLRFLIPSLIGVLLFLTPIRYQGKETIVMGVLSDWMRNPLLGILPGVVVLISVISALASIAYLLLQPKHWAVSHPYLLAIAHAGPVWVFLRVVGAICGILFLFKIGPEAVWGKQTGGAVFVDIGTNMLVIFLQACFLMPFLTEFGLMEFVGTLLRRLFESVFRLPGRAAIDAMASFVAAASVGLLITIGQYERGYYSARHAAVIATNFSVVSVPFALVIAEVSGLGAIFFSWYATVILACLICAVITPRLPPLSGKQDTYFESSGPRLAASSGKGSLFSQSLDLAVRKAATGPGVKLFLKGSARQALDVIFGVIPPCMGLALITAIVVFHTDAFSLVSYPIRLLLEALRLPEAQIAAPGFIVGFLDQFMPAIIAANIEDQTTRFVLAGLSVGQLIYISEVGVLILRSPLPLNFRDLASIFALRTLILLPVFYVAGRWLT